MKYDTPKMELFVTIVCITVMAAWLCAVTYMAARLNIPDGPATIVAERSRRERAARRSVVEMEKARSTGCKAGDRARGSLRRIKSS